MAIAELVSRSERNKLADLLVALPEFTDDGIRGRRMLLKKANLTRFLAMPLNGADRLVAGELVEQLADHGFLEELPRYHALGALLSYLLEDKLILPKDRRFMAEVLTKYSLVQDPDYLERIRREFNLPKPAVTIAPTAIPQEGPDFQPPIADAKGLEQVIHSEDNFLDIYLLAGAIYCARAVCLIEFPADTPRGTGFLIGPDLLLTNQHVLKNQEYASGAVLKFDYRIDALGVKQEPRTFKLATDFYYSSPEDDLDYALVRVADEPLKHLVVDDKTSNLTPLEMIQQGRHRGYLLVVPEHVPEGDRVYVVQHPEGREMKVVLTQNYVASEMQAKRLHYVADTMGGSSGSPVLNKRWEVVALHHSGKPYPPESNLEAAKKAWKGYFRVNEGIAMKAILADFKEKGLDKFLPRE